MCMIADARHWHAWARQWQIVRDSCERASFCSASNAQTGAGVKATFHVKTRHGQSCFVFGPRAMHNMGVPGIPH